MSTENVIEFENVSKLFTIPHTRTNSIFKSMTNLTTKKYDKLTVLENISFKIKKGEMVGILGKNGSGKTTVMKLIAKILKPNYGKIKINGSIVPLIGMGAGFQPDLTLTENIILYGTILGFTPKEIHNKVPEILKFAELENFAFTKLRFLSNGMISRLGFSTAIQVQPEILLVDEILAVGDVKFREKSYNKFLSLKNDNRTIIYVSHNLDSIKQLCDRAILLDNGKIISDGFPDEVVKIYLDLMKK